MNKSELIKTADQEGVGDGYIIRGYCDVNGDKDVSVMCVKDKTYSEVGGSINDCIHQAKTDKLKCKFWNKIKTPIKI
jgi:hypothetical protein